MDSASASPKEKKGLGRLWTKFKLALKPRSKTKSKTKPTTGISDGVNPSQPQPQPQSIQPPEPQQQRMVESSQMTEATTDPADTMEPTKTEQPLNVSANSAALVAEDTEHDEPQDAVQPSTEPTPLADKQEFARRYERAQAVFRRYNYDLDEIGWEARAKPQVERVHKAPRIRVRWTCHECKTTFGHDKICAECAHQRCRTCPRYPPKKKKAKAAKQAALAATMNEPSQEAREGTCHECQTTFDLGAPECSNCHHIICERCLQESIATAEVEPPVVAPTS